MKETEFMSNGGRRMNRASGFMLILTTAILTACAAGAPGAPVAGAGDAELDPQIVRAQYERALAFALTQIERDPTNARHYMTAGQSALSLERWVMADTMFTRAEELNPRLADEIALEREEGWVAAVNLGAHAMQDGDLDTAVEFFRAADMLYQARPEALTMLGSVHERRGEAEQAITAYSRALEIYAQGPPDELPAEYLESWDRDRQAATFNLANLLARAGRAAEAADILGSYLAQAPASLEAAVRLEAMTARAALLTQAGRTAEAEVIYEELLGRGDLGHNEYLQIGIGMFNAGDYERAVDAFGNAARINPYSRDAQLNLIQSLHAAASDLEQEPRTPARDQRLHAMYDRLLATADRVDELDPLNRTLLQFTLRAYQAKANISPAAEAQRLRARGQEVFRAAQEQVYEVSDLAIERAAEGGSRFRGLFTNLAGTPGQQVELRFTVVDANGTTLDSGTARVTVPAVEETVEFTLVMRVAPLDFAGWRYELVR
jgi:tetratricopeptide (TPR) repeat protein